MKIINKSQISHIVVYNNRKGVKIFNNFCDYTYYEDEYFKLFWLFPIKTLEKGLYRGSIKSSLYRRCIELDKNKYYSLLGEVYTYPHIDIFCAKEKIHTEYFEDYKDLEKHLENNYKDFDVRYETT